MMTNTNCSQNAGQYQRSVNANCSQNAGQYQRSANANCGQNPGQHQRSAAGCQQGRPMPYQSQQMRNASACGQNQSQQMRNASACGQNQSYQGAQASMPRQMGNASCGCGGASREQLLMRITLTKFACVEAGLYLDTHPEDTEAIRYFQENDRIYQEAMSEYAKAYGPLTLTHAHHNSTYWDWVNQPWPWQ